jgi:hypothetical protein
MLLRSLTPCFHVGGRWQTPNESENDGHDEQF